MDKVSMSRMYLYYLISRYYRTLRSESEIIYDFLSQPLLILPEYYLSHKKR